MNAAPTAITFAVWGRLRHCSRRLFEWCTAMMMALMGVTIIVSPNSVASGGFHLMQNVGFTPGVLIVFFLVASALRCVGLYLNGNWPVYGPWCRAAGALGGVVIWLQMCASLVMWSDQAGYISMGVPVYLVLAFGELVSCYRAASDGRAKR